MELLALCPHCQTPFDPVVAGKVRRAYCSPRCAARASEKRRLQRRRDEARVVRPTSRLCGRCGRTFDVNKQETNPRKWCSQKCRDAVWGESRAQRQPMTVERTCKVCRSTFVKARSSHLLICSEDCREFARKVAQAKTQAKQRRSRRLYLFSVCVICNAAFCDSSATGTRKFCGIECKRVAESARNVGRGSHKSRIRRTVVAAGDRINRLKLGERDGWCCWICGQHVDKVLRNRHPMMGSVDHVVPISKGGKHVWSNVKLAHLRCNIARGNKDVIDAYRQTA